MHDFLSEDAELNQLAKMYNVLIRDIRKPPRREKLHFFSGKINEVDSLKIAVLGTDSASGKPVVAVTISHENLKEDEIVMMCSFIQKETGVPVYDLIAQKKGVPLCDMLGKLSGNIKTSVTIGINTTRETIEKSKEWLSAGFSCLKIKGGLDVEEDIEKILKLREDIGEEIELRFDANQGYDLVDAGKFINRTKKANLSFIEQPTHRDDLESLKILSEQSSTPIMADETLISLKDAKYLASNRIVHMFNIKLMKTGGLFGAMKIGEIARRYNIPVMIGCMDESALGIAAGLHLALSQPWITMADLDGHLDLVDDPFEGMVKLKKGSLYPSDKNGLGFSPENNINIG